MFTKNNAPTGFYVYLYLREDGRPYYVGKGKGSRAWCKHGKVKVPSDPARLMFVATGLLEIGAFILERKFIRWYGRKDLGTGILVNRTEGGEGSSGSKWTEEQRANIRGRTVTEETKARLREANLGKKQSIEVRMKLSAIRLGKKKKPCTPEGRANIKAANQGKNLGRVLSEETKAKIKASNKATWARKQSNDQQL
jgi:hypothetical protein